MIYQFSSSATLKSRSILFKIRTTKVERFYRGFECRCLTNGQKLQLQDLTELRDDSVKIVFVGTRTNLRNSLFSNGSVFRCQDTLSKIQMPKDLHCFYGFVDTNCEECKDLRYLDCKNNFCGKWVFHPFILKKVNRGRSQVINYIQAIEDFNFHPTEKGRFFR